MTTTNKTAELLSLVTPTVRNFAKKLAAQSGGSVEAADLIQVGLIAALKCAETFDASKGAAFRTYCWHPVMEAMRREKNGSRSVLGTVSRSLVSDISFAAPVITNAESDETFGDLIPSEEESVEMQAMNAQREEKVREIVARVRRGFQNKNLFDDLLARLMASHFAGEGKRLRSEVPLAAFAEKYQMSRQGIHAHEKKVREVLTRALVPVAQES